MTTMLIGIEPTGFTWTGQAVRYLVATELHAEGIVRLYRGGQIFDTAYVVRPYHQPHDPARPNGGKFSKFFGLQKVNGVAYVDILSANAFALGDRLEIDIPAGVNEAEYWDEMQDSP